MVFFDPDLPWLFVRLDFLLTPSSHCSITVRRSDPLAVGWSAWKAAGKRVQGMRRGRNSGVPGFSTGRDDGAGGGRHMPPAVINMRLILQQPDSTTAQPSIYAEKTGRSTEKFSLFVVV